MNGEGVGIVITPTGWSLCGTLSAEFALLPPFNSTLEAFQLLKKKEDAWTLQILFPLSCSLSVPGHNFTMKIVIFCLGKKMYPPWKLYPYCCRNCWSKIRSRFQTGRESGSSMLCKPWCWSRNWFHSQQEESQNLDCILQWWTKDVVQWIKGRINIVFNKDISKDRGTAHLQQFERTRRTIDFSFLLRYLFFFVPIFRCSFVRYLLLSWGFFFRESFHIRQRFACQSRLQVQI